MMGWCRDLVYQLVYYRGSVFGYSIFQISKYLPKY